MVSSFLVICRSSHACLPVGALRLQAQATSQLSKESEDLNSGPYICTTSILPTEQLPQPQLLHILCWK